MFKRYELKYRISLEQKQRLLQAMAPYMRLDKYGRTTIRNIYFDTDSYRLIRHSIERPNFKEKLRLRSYCQTKPDSTVFVELKRKCDGLVYKRRVSMQEAEAMDWLCGGDREHSGQISAEVDYFLTFYGDLRPTVFLSYEREAYYSIDGSDFRVTFDDHVLCRTEALSLCEAVYGTPLLPADQVLMEIKCSGGIPMWMVQVLSRERIYKTSFSKYGTAYQTMIYPKQKEIANHVSSSVSGAF